MNFFEDSFKSKLYETVEQIEQLSVAEVVVIVRKKSEKYRDISLIYSICASFVVFTILMFIRKEIDAYLIYLITILMFPIVFFTIELIPNLQRFLLSKKRINKSVEILGRALFQKGGVRFTQKRIGILVFVSLLEKKVLLIADRGVEESVPNQDIENFETEINKIFNFPQSAEKFLDVLSNLKKILNQYLPPVENDINELPDNLNIEL